MRTSHSSFAAGYSLFRRHCDSVIVSSLNLLQVCLGVTMPKQVLLIEPIHELKFKVSSSGVFEPGNITYLRLLNPTFKMVLFKIKTTAPKKYCVRPNSGFVKPNDKVDIAITPQPVSVEPNEKHKHKFMVQSIVSEGEVNIEQVWKEATPEQLMDHKLKCVFETPHGSNDAGDGAGQVENKKRVPAAEEKQTKDAVEASIVNEVKRKEPDDKTQKATSLGAKPENADGDVLKAGDNSMREEENKLRNEVNELKEELLRLRKARDGRNLGPHQYSAGKPAGQNSLLPWLMIAVGMAILGIIIGKFIM